MLSLSWRPEPDLMIQLVVALTEAPRISGNHAGAASTEAWQASETVVWLSGKAKMLT
jgi:hypothetical protein